MSEHATAPDFGNVFVATALVILPLAVLAPVAIALAAILPALWIAVIYLRCRIYPWTGRSWLIPAALVGIIAYGAATVIWSIAPDRSLSTVAKLIPIAVGGWLFVGAASQLDDKARQRTASALLIGGAITVALLAIEIATGGLIHSLLRDGSVNATGSLYHVNRTASQMAILIWPMWLVLDRRFGAVAAAAAIAVVAILLLRLDPDTPLVTLFAGALFLAFAYFAPRLAQALMVAGLVVVALAIPLYPLILPFIDSTLLSWGISDFTLRHRFAIWDFAATRTMEQPLLGWGLGASRLVPGGEGIIEQLSSQAEMLPLHPHNALLQLWLELGVPGVALALLLVITALAKISRLINGRKEVATALVVIFTATLIAELSYGIWQSWWLVFLWLLAALTIAVTGGRSQPRAA